MADILERRSASGRVKSIFNFTMKTLNVLDVVKSDPPCPYTVVKPKNPKETFRDCDFRRRFRFTKETFDFVLHQIRAGLPRVGEVRVGRPPIEAEVSK